MLCPVSSTTPTRRKKESLPLWRRMRVLPLPMGEVPLEGAERANFTLSVGFAASSPKVGAKEKRGERIVTGGGHTSDIGRLLAKTRVNCRFSCRGGQWPPAFLRRFPKKMGGHWPPLLALSVILIPTQIQKGLPSGNRRQAFFAIFEASYFHRPSGYLPASVMAFRAFTTMGLSAA